MVTVQNQIYVIKETKAIIPHLYYLIAEAVDVNT